ncbi:hypothetical protein R1flu_023122 [Riccia fluitans]|uniref:Uncharacterized protein n=1 Tax=Riccia fluitans TaxID=41844 RepID=A0ABD1XR65_9MARC
MTLPLTILLQEVQELVQDSLKMEFRRRSELCVEEKGLTRKSEELKLPSCLQDAVSASATRHPRPAAFEESLVNEQLKP